MSAKNNMYASKYADKSISGSSIRDSFTGDSERKNSKIFKTFQKTQIQVKNQILDDLLQVYGWRSKTQLPIAKVMFYKVVQRNPTESSTTIEVSYESFPLTLSSLSQISIPNILYLLKQSIIGFQKLFSVFGSFLISNKMIGINKNNRCKVWINQNFAVNQPIDVEMFKNLNQKIFMNQVIDLFKKKAEKGKNNNVLFNELANFLKFEEAAQFIDSFAKNIGVEIGTSYRIEEKDQRRNNMSKSPLKNPNQMTNTSFMGQKTKRIPQFLNKSQAGQIKDIDGSMINSSRMNTRVEKSKSITKSAIRERTPLTHNRSQANLCIPSKSSIKISLKLIKNDEITQKLDYSFQKKNKSSSPLQSKQTKQLLESISFSSQQQIQNKHEGKHLLHPDIKSSQKTEVLKSDINTTNTNNSAITIKARSLLQKKASLFDVDRDMLESLVIGRQHDRPKNNLYSTSDLEHLGKLGKTVVQSCLPQDFNN